MFINRDGNVLNARSWTKSSKLAFHGGLQSGLFQVLAVNTFKSLDGMEDWMVYNALDTLDNWFGDRDTFAQKFVWNADGTPNFGQPLPLTAAIPVPSGETLSPRTYAPGSPLLLDDYPNLDQWTVVSGVLMGGMALAGAPRPAAAQTVTPVPAPPTAQCSVQDAIAGTETVETTDPVGLNGTPDQQCGDQNGPDTAELCFTGHFVSLGIQRPDCVQPRSGAAGGHYDR